jgi:hypothetical protein
MTNPIHNTESIIDSRDVIARIKDLQGERQLLVDELQAAADCVQYHHAEVLDKDGTYPEHAEYRRCLDELSDWDEENNEELLALEALAEDGERSAEDWEHGAALINDSYFETYARELAEDIGAIDRNASWPLMHIDWEAAAKDLQQDYSAIEFDGVTFWVR